MKYITFLNSQISFKTITINIFAIINIFAMLIIINIFAILNFSVIKCEPKFHTSCLLYPLGCHVMNQWFSITYENMKVFLLHEGNICTHKSFIMLTFFKLA